MGFKVDLTGVEMKNFDPLPDGKYLAKVDDMVFTAKSKRSAQPKEQFSFTALKGLTAGTEDYDPETHRKFFYEVSLQDQSLWNLKRALIALGDDPKDLEGEIDVENLKEDYVGRECILVVYTEEYQGVERNKVRRIEPVKAPAPATA